MTVKPYPAYRASGVQWLGSIPETWSVERIRRRARLRTDKAVDASLKVALENVESWTGRFIDTEEADYSGEGIAFSRGDVLFGKLRPYLAKAWRADTEGAAIGDFHVYSLGSDTDPRFFQFMILSGDFLSLVDGSTYGAKMPRASWDFIGNLMEAFPPIAEQRQIADYLDAQTAKIDTLIGKQEQLIETLAERRQAVISHAVTKGLDPNAPMKDSGVPWLGVVPVTWTVEAIKRRGSTGAGAGFPHEFQGRDDEEIPFHKVNVLGRASSDGVIRVQSESVSTETAALLRARIFPAGSLVMAKIGAALLLGRIRVLGRPACIDNNMMSIQVADTVDARFMFWALDMIQFDWLVNPGAVPSTSEGAVGNYKLAFPPLAQQREIAEYLDRETVQIDTLSAKAREMIDVLKERRQALISAAVTGKIDVRGLA